MRSLPPLFLLLLPSLLGCSPAVEFAEPSAGEVPEVQDAEEFLGRDDDAYRGLTDRCGCSTEVYDASGWRL